MVERIKSDEAIKGIIENLSEADGNYLAEMYSLIFAVDAEYNESTDEVVITTKD